MLSSLLGGNSNTGPQIAKMLCNYHITAKILEIDSETVRRVGMCCNMINLTSNINPNIFYKWAEAAFRSVMSDVGNFSNITANTHALLCHGSQYIRYCQKELGVSVGQLSENSLEMGNKLNLQYRKIFSRRGSIKKENYDIFKRRLLISDPFLIIKGVNKQQLRDGNVLKYKETVMKI